MFDVPWFGLDTESTHKEKRKFLNSAASRETSPSIMRAILRLAGGRVNVAERVWADPTDDEIRVIWRWVTGGVTETTDYCWGAAGSNWLRGLDCALYIIEVRYYHLSGGWMEGGTLPPAGARYANQYPGYSPHGFHTIGEATAIAAAIRLENAACGLGADVWIWAV